ncbi:helix-turn-helix domain-containing protein [Amycolatopsis samaneae]|uniref:Helix-turn-helix transcriptional regulator n=1 Tax=Amycolatopsis samaneae TaxID=664691 RepID=A0ABW5GAG3_9PSEU
MSAPTPSGPDRARLATRLREIRAATGMSGNRFAKHLGWPQSRVSKIETGAQFPTGEDITAWLDAAGARGEEGAVTELLTRARVESVSFRETFRDQGGAAANQRRWLERGQEATRIAEFHAALVPGLLQTPAYARELVALPAGPADLADAPPEDVERMVAVRIERQAVLYDPGKTVSLVIGEAALWVRFGSVETQLGQLDRLRSLAEVRTVDLRIIPFSVAMPVAPLHGFMIFDDRFVQVETQTGEVFVVAPDEIAVYERLFGRLRGAAVAGGEAVKLIQRVARQLTASDS